MTHQLLRALDAFLMREPEPERLHPVVLAPSPGWHPDFIRQYLLEAEQLGAELVWPSFAPTPRWWPSHAATVSVARYRELAGFPSPSPSPAPSPR